MGNHCCSDLHHRYLSEAMRRDENRKAKADSLRKNPASGSLFLHKQFGSSSCLLSTERGGFRPQQGTLRPSRTKFGNSTEQFLNAGCTLKVLDFTGIVVLVSPQRLSDCAPSREINIGIVNALKSKAPWPAPLSSDHLCCIGKCNPSTDTSFTPNVS